MELGTIGAIGFGGRVSNLLETPKPLLQATKGLNLNKNRSINQSQLIEVETKEDRIKRIKSICGVQDHRKKKRGKRNGKK